MFHGIYVSFRSVKHFKIIISELTTDTILRKKNHITLHPQKIFFN